MNPKGRDGRGRLREVFPLFSAWSSAAARTGFERTAITRGDFLEHSTLRQCSFNFSQRCGDPTHAAAAASQQNQYSRQHRPLTLLVRARRRQKACDVIQVSRFDHFVARAVRSLHLCDSKPYPRMPRLDAWRGSSRLTEVAFRLAASFSPTRSTRRSSRASPSLAGLISSLLRSARAAALSGLRATET